MTAAGAAITVLSAIAMLCGSPSSAHPPLGVFRAIAPGRCFVVHGRLAIGNGTPSVRIWPVGTKRILGVNDAQNDPEGEELFPPDVRRMI